MLYKADLLRMILHKTPDNEQVTTVNLVYEVLRVECSHVDSLAPV